jgi:quercetin dioxygenase-like cupin family protein
MTMKMKNIFTRVGLIMFTAIANASQELPTVIKYRDIIHRQPDQQSPVVKVWTIHKDETIRINLVEMSGELKLHKHPDAAHSLMVLEGSVKALVGSSVHILEKGDYISIPADVPHKYWALTSPSMLVSMDAPYYRVTTPLE